MTAFCVPRWDLYEARHLKGGIGRRLLSIKSRCGGSVSCVYKKVGHNSAFSASFPNSSFKTVASSEVLKHFPDAPSEI